MHISGTFTDHSQATATDLSMQANLGHAIATEALAPITELALLGQVHWNPMIDLLMEDDPTVVLSRPFQRKQELRNRTSLGARLQLGHYFF